jgi:hypothetical protein
MGSSSLSLKVTWQIVSFHIQQEVPQVTSNVPDMTDENQQHLDLRSHETVTALGMIAVTTGFLDCNS